MRNGKEAQLQKPSLFQFNFVIGIGRAQYALVYLIDGLVIIKLNPVFYLPPQSISTGLS